MLIGKYNIRPFTVVLQELPEKEAFIRKHFMHVGMESEYFNGISADVSGLRTLFPYEVDAPGSGWNMGSKPVATWLSFYMLWSAMNLLPESHFWQLEWDCHFPNDWRPRVEKALNDVPPDFDLLFIGSCCAENKPRTQIAGDVWEVKYPVCGHSTIIAKKALPIMLKTQRKVYAPLDISLAFHTLPLLKTYVVLPRICDQFNTELQP
jgi:hypothetical protein